MSSDLTFTSRDIRTIRDDIIAYIKRQAIGWTDFSQSDIGVILIEIIAGCADMLNYYTDAQALECFLNTAIEPKNIRGILDAYNYPYRLVQPARGKVKFTLNRDGAESPTKDVTIPKWTQLKTPNEDPDNQVGFVTLETVRIKAGETTVEVPIEQGLKEKLEFTTDELSHSYKFPLGGKDIPKDGVRIIQPDGEWTRVDDAFTQTEGGKIFSVHYSPSGEAYILFSYNWLQFLPENKKELIQVLVLHSVGEKGNVGVGQITFFEGPLFDTYQHNTEKYMTVTNESALYGAKDEEDWIKAKANARNFIMSMGRAVTHADYEGLLRADPTVCDLYLCDKRTDRVRCAAPFEVKAWVVFNDGPVEDPNTLANLVEPLQKKLQDSCDILVDFRVYQAKYEIRNVDIVLDLTVSDRDTQEEIQQMVREKVAEWGSFKNWKMKSYVDRRDLISFILRLDDRIHRLAVVGFDDPIDCDVDTVPFIKVNTVEIATEFEETIRKSGDVVVTTRKVTTDRQVLSKEDVLSENPSQAQVRQAVQTVWPRLGGQVEG